MAVDKEWVVGVTRDWVTLTDNITDMTADDVLYAMELEGEHQKPRKTFMRRLNQRYVSIRAEEARKELEG